MRPFVKPRAWLVAFALLGCPTASEVDAGVDAAGPVDARVDAPQVDAPLGTDAGVGVIDTWLVLLAAGDEAAIDRARHTQAWAGGWPIHEGGRWLFVTRQEDRPAQVSLVGDLNGWDTASVAQRGTDGVHFWAVLEDSALVSPALGSKYKWFVAGDFRAPLEATQYGFDTNGRFGWVLAPSDVAHLEQFPDLASMHLSDRRSVRVFVPARFDAARARTLLLHDGQNVFHPDAFFGGWRVDEALASRGNVLAVAIDNAPDRMDAYTQVEDDIGSGPLGGRALDYLELVQGEVLPFVRTRYGVAARGSSLAMMGSSLGGLVTLVAASADFEDMACGAAMSSTVGWGSIGSGRPGSATLIGTWRGALTPVYFDSGGRDGGGCRDTDADGVNDDSDDADNYCVNVQLRDVLMRQGYTSANLTYAWQRDAMHNEAAWAARAGDALDACTRMGWAAP
jgi:hypothetical protein